MPQPAIGASIVVIGIVLVQAGRRGTQIMFILLDLSFAANSRAALPLQADHLHHFPRLLTDPTSPTSRASIHGLRYASARLAAKSMFRLSPTTPVHPSSSVPDKKDAMSMSMDPCHVCGRANFDNYRVLGCHLTT